MTDIDIIITTLFKERWSGYLSNGDIKDQRKQLHKTLTDQLNMFWSGHTAYHIAVDGGFLIDSKYGTNKRLTRLGEMFMQDMLREYSQ